MELMRGLDKEIEMPLPTSSGYNPSNRDSSSSPTLASTVGETSSDQPPQTSDHYHLNHPPPSLPSNPLQQLQRNTRDPDPPSVTAITTIASRSNPGPATARTIRYRECLKNHAASMGGHVVDGCGEFMPSGEEGTPQSLRCAACDCHRNFHRKETEGEPQTNVLNYYAYPPSKSNNAQSRILSPQFPPPPPLHHHHHHQHMRFSGGSFPPLMMAFGGGGGAAESSSEDLNMFQCNDVGGQGSSKKRFRTKFSQEQKDRMMEFAEKLGWRIQKHDEQEVQQFCNQAGVKRQVFKVWMHNNKQAMKKKQII
ncbi:zinc-finger homeodomain protein 6-like isoform X2 [Neltuma alba]|uniref:zinc-finger homeodomain protein 6-like n=1 Tax=Neltuma alba TaxID=207710 RepID=UPI0010A50A6A|nr:zinc-finger homeodomain protein 6-like [Prosopis alba]XP_028788148.1 zinc-finger homeodomain protein 6-like isoform X2 [Prosopis alba]